MARAATTSDAFNAVAEPCRREILNYLAIQEKPVGDIVASLGVEGCRPGPRSARRAAEVLSHECGGDPAFA
jgi:hypothetical protein